MKLTVIGSGSSGNTYLVECNDEILILDCGISTKEVKKALNFDLSKIVGCFISHTHQDHNKYRKEYENIGIEVVAPYDTNPNRLNKSIGHFNLQAFKVPHGDCDCWGCLIRHMVTNETILYVTDYEYVSYVFKACKINHYLIECNYQIDYVDLDAPNKEHKLRAHASLDTCKDFIKVNYTGDCKSVILCHLGFGSTNPNECVDEIKTLTDKRVTVDYARANVTYEL